MKDHVATFQHLCTLCAHGVRICVIACVHVTLCKVVGPSAVSCSRMAGLWVSAGGGSGLGPRDGAIGISYFDYYTVPLPLLSLTVFLLLYFLF